MSELIELSTFHLKDDPPVPPPLVVSSLKFLSAAAGLIALYWGPHIESDTTYTYVARWETRAHKDTFYRDNPFWHDSFSADVDTLSVLCSEPVEQQDPAVPFEAPCTEIFSSFGAEDDYLESRLKPFVKAITDAKPPGLVGGFPAEFHPTKHLGVRRPESKIFVLLMGWNTKADHDAQKEEGKVVSNNLHLIRSGRKSVHLYHVNFNKL
ncbi:hypothetical protein CCMA1212_009760 [Trichoderma ghanense]|uniref:ABM domain-containing protein n=1 Tax=Trichoderma ghanense TaxID=65468 RepID=A0ABY2GSA0_9HYPO